LLHGARALVFPSLIEGFGLPVIEAMASGCPVLASDIPVLREVCGDAALYAEPTSADQIAQAMQALASSAELRQTHRERGLERAREFSWRRCAEQTWEVYRALL
jgi:glycosyltransferase involved in cell wall biosynthesis